MNKVEKAFTYRLYCPRKWLVKRTIDRAFPVSIVTQQCLAWNSQSPIEKITYCLGGSTASGGCSP
jgi:hypothetical protein